jgi:hypothetical protein
MRKLLGVINKGYELFANITTATLQLNLSSLMDGVTFICILERKQNIITARNRSNFLKQSIILQTIL